MDSIVNSVGESIVRRNLLCGLLTVGLSLLLAGNSAAGLFTISDDNSSVDFDTDNQGNAVNWTVDGQDQLFQQGFWYRIGNAGPEQSLDTLPHPIEGTSDTDLDTVDDTLYVKYDAVDGSFSVEVRYSLDGGIPGSGASDMGEQITINNFSLQDLDFHFFQYADFDLLATPGGERAQFTNANSVRQWEGLLRLTETVVTPVPNHREIDFYANTLAKLNDGVATTLSDTPPIGTTLGVGDMTWAFQWDFTIPPESSIQISKDKNLSAGEIPEPASIALLCVAAAFVGLARRRK